MGLIDKFLDAIKLNDDFDDDDDFFDEEIEKESKKEEKPKRRFFNRIDDEDDDDFLDDEEIAPAPKSSASRSKNTSSGKKDTPSRSVREEKNIRKEKTKEQPVRRERNEKTTKKAAKTASQKSRAKSSMEVNVIKPTDMEDAREIVDTLLDNCTVVLNLEGLDVDMAQRIIDFTCGSCYSLDGSIQMISNYIFILTPASVDVSGDYQSILSNAFDVPSMRTHY